MIKLKRIIEPVDRADGMRVLVDRLWPRGVRKEEASVDAWMKELAPSSGLRRWFGHRAERWREFRRRYFAELDMIPQRWRPLVNAAKRGCITLLYSASDQEHNNAVALKDYLREKALRS